MSAAERVGGDLVRSASEPRVQAPEELPDDEFDRSLRPRRLADFVGQPAVKAQLALAIEAAASREEALDHVYSFDIRERELNRKSWTPTVLQK